MSAARTARLADDAAKRSAVDPHGVGRKAIDYTAPRQSVRQFEGFDPDTPITGYYQMRLRSGAVRVGVRIWFGPPLDPVTGEEMDRSHRWQAHVNGSYFDLERVWPKCAAEPIDETEYRYLGAIQAVAQQRAPDSPHANPMRRINPLTAPTPF